MQNGLFLQWYLKHGTIEGTQLARAFVAPGKTLTEEDVLTFCEKLPKYKRPRKIFFGNVPRNPTGKIEKPKLRKQYTGIREAFKI